MFNGFRQVVPRFKVLLYVLVRAAGCEVCQMERVPSSVPLTIHGPRMLNAVTVPSACRQSGPSSRDCRSVTGACTFASGRALHHILKRGLLAITCRACLRALAGKERRVESCL